MFIKFFYYPLGLVAVLGFLLPFGPTSVMAATTAPSLTIVTAPYTAEEVLEQINDARIAAGLNSLTNNTKLAAAAQQKADDMITRNYFNHDTPDGQMVWTFVQNAGYHYRLAGENLGLHYNSATLLVDAWLNSPSHRHNIMTADFTDTGIGIAYGENQGHRGWFVVHLFGAEF